MRLSTMRRVDYFVGTPLCLLVAATLRIASWLRPAHREAGTRTVLFIELSEMGSTILASSLIKRIQTQHRPAEHCFVILRKNAPSLRLLGLFPEDCIFTLRDDSLVAMATDVFRFMRFCRARRIDTVVDLELFARISSLLSMLSGAETRVGFHNYRGEGLYRGDHLTHRVHYNPYQHMSQNFLALGEALDGPHEIPTPKRRLAPQAPPVKAAVEPVAFEHVRNELRRCYPLTDHHRIIVVNHDAGELLPIRSWPRERFVELIRRLLARDERRVVVLMGITAVAESARDIADRVGDPRCVDFVGRTRTLDDVVQLFHQSDLLVTNDSGPAHFASLTAIKSITLFGPETPILYGNMGDDAVHLFAHLACSPCLSALNHRESQCTDNKCLQAIAVDDVLAAAERLLAMPSSRVTAANPDRGGATASR